MKKLLLAFIAVTLSADTSVTFSTKFVDLLKPEEAKAIGLDHANEQQKKAFAKWATDFAVKIVNMQHEQDQADCIAAVTAALK